MIEAKTFGEEQTAWWTIIRNEWASCFQAKWRYPFRSWHNRRYSCLESVLCVAHRRRRLVDQALMTLTLGWLSGGKTLIPYLPPMLPEDWLAMVCDFWRRTDITWRRVIAHSIPSRQTRPDIHRVAKLRGTADGIGIKPNHLRVMTPWFKGAHVWVVLAIIWRQVEGLFSIVPHVRSGDCHLLLSTKSLGVSGTVSSYVLTIPATIDSPTKS